MALPDTHKKSSKSIEIAQYIGDALAVYVKNNHSPIHMYLFAIDMNDVKIGKKEAERLVSAMLYSPLNLMESRKGINIALDRVKFIEKSTIDIFGPDNFDRSYDPYTTIMEMINQSARIMVSRINKGWEVKNKDLCTLPAIRALAETSGATPEMIETVNLLEAAVASLERVPSTKWVKKTAAPAP